MRIPPSVWFLGLLLNAMWGCSVVSQEVKNEALPPIPLPVLISDVQKYMGDTVIVGGRVVSVENKADYTEIIAVQSPLGLGQRPKARDLSQGRLVVVYKGFIDPEVYTKDREITIGGTIIGSSAQIENPSYPYLKIEVRDIHLWAKEERRDPYWGRYYPYPYPWRWYHRYHHRYWYH